MEMLRRSNCVYIEDDASTSLEHVFIPLHYQGVLENVLISHGSIQDRIEKLGFDISNDYDTTVHLLCVLKGGSTYFFDLCKAIEKFHSYSRKTYIPFTFDFVKVKSYEGTESSGTVQISGVDLASLKGKNLILVEDIIDTGLTMTSVLAYLQSTCDPASVKVTSLLEKRTVHSNGFVADYVGFSIPDKFVVGYCLDYNEVYRDLPHICVINGAGIDQYK